MEIQTIDLTGDTPSRPMRSLKRKRKANQHNNRTQSGGSKAIDLTHDDEADEIDVPLKKKAKVKAAKETSAEKRLKRHRPTVPSSIKAVYDRAVNQRMFCLDRQRGEDVECPTETLKIAGSTGNVYTVVIGRVPSCDCPHATKGNECKHVLFSLVRVLRAKDYWQRAYLWSELREIFENAPAIVPVDAEKTDNNRKPIDPDDTCPICFMELEGEEGTVYCIAACGNNIHKECFDQWAASRRRSSAPVTCPFCRSRWASGDGAQGKVSMDTVSQRRATGEGYVNVAEELGISAQRDYNSYHSFWVRRQRREGLNVGDWDDPDPDWGERYRGRYGD